MTSAIIVVPLGATSVVVSETADAPRCTGYLAASAVVFMLLGAVFVILSESDEGALNLSW